MKAQVLVDERRDEVIAVVVAVAHPQVERDARTLAGFSQKLRLELALEEWIEVAPENWTAG